MKRRNIAEVRRCCNGSILTRVTPAINKTF